MIENATIDSIVDFGEFQPFEGAEVIRPTICILQKEKGDGHARLFKWLTKGRPPENLSDVVAHAPILSTSHLNEATWELEPDDGVYQLFDLTPDEIKLLQREVEN